MPELKLTIDLASLQCPFEQALRTAAQLGLKAVQIDARGPLAPRELSQTGVRQVRKLLADHGLSVTALRFRTRRGYSVPDDLDARIEGTKNALRLAYALGARIVLNQPGRIPGDAQLPEWTLLVEVLDDLGRYGLRTGATLALEAGQENPADLARLLAALPAASLGIDLNPGDLTLHGFSAAEAARSLGSSVLAVHLTDAVREAHRGGGDLVLPGQGQVEYPSLLGVLEEQGYRGALTLVGLSQSHAARDVAQTLEFLRRL